MYAATSANPAVWGLEMLDLAVLVDSCPNRVPVPSLKRSRKKEGAGRPQDARGERAPIQADDFVG